MKSENRRDFISELGKSLVDFGIKRKIPVSEEVKILLTRDGRLVKVPISIIEKAIKTKAEKKDIDEWTEPVNNKSDE